MQLVRRIEFKRVIVFFCKEKPAYEMRIRDWSSDMCSCDLSPEGFKPNRSVPIISSILNGGHQAGWLAKARAGGTAVCLCRDVMNCKYWIRTITGLTQTDKPVVFIKTVFRW